MQEIAEKYEDWLVPEKKVQSPNSQAQVLRTRCVSFPNFYSQPPFTRDIVITTTTGELANDYKNFKDVIIKVIKKSF